MKWERSTNKNLPPICSFFVVFVVLNLNLSIDKDFIHRWHLVSLTLSGIAVAFLLCVYLHQTIKLWEGLRRFGSYLDSVTQHMTCITRWFSFVNSKHMTAKKCSHVIFFTKKGDPFIAWVKSYSGVQIMRLSMHSYTRQIFSFMNNLIMYLAKSALAVTCSVPFQLETIKQISHHTVN